MDQSKYDRMVELYIKLRDECSAIKTEADAKIEAIKTNMTAIEAVLADMLGSAGGKSVTFPSGRVSTRVTTSYSTPDWGGFKEWARENNRLDMLQNRLNNSAIADYLSIADELPPGVFADHKAAVVITRSKS